MTARRLMTTRICVLGPQETVARALKVLHLGHVQNVPVVGQEGALLGLFGIRHIARLLLPMAAKLGERHSLDDLSFLPDGLETLSRRLARVRDRPLGEFMQPVEELVVCRPDTPIPELLELLTQDGVSALPVVESPENGRRLVGILSLWDVIDGLVMKEFEGLDPNDLPCHQAQSGISGREGEG